MAKKQKMDKTSKILMIVLIAVVALVGIGLVTNATNAKTETLNSLAYDIGALDAEGKYIKDTGSIVTKGFHSVEDMEISIAKDAMITYKVFYFDENEDFISADSSANSADYAGSAPEGATLFKVVITPTNDAEVSWNEIGNYAGQLEVVCAKA